MGWTFIPGSSKSQIVQRCMEPGFLVNGATGERVGKYDYPTFKVVGKSLWAVLRVVYFEDWEDFKANEEYYQIALFMLAQERGYGWGWNGMSESSGPYDYTCPMAMLKAYPLDKKNFETSQGYMRAMNWRSAVEHYHYKMNRDFKVGDVYVAGRETPRYAGKKVTITDIRRKNVVVRVEGESRQWLFQKDWLEDKVN